MQPLLMLQEQLKLLLWSEVLFRAEPHRPDAVLQIGAQLWRASPDTPITGENNKTALGNERHPLQVRCAGRNLG